jgi:hypothetical protein
MKPPFFNRLFKKGRVKARSSYLVGLPFSPLCPHAQRTDKRMDLI